MRSLQYKYPVKKLYTGSSLGNLYAFARLDSQSNVNGLWSSIDNQFYLGEWDIEIQNNGKALDPLETVFTPASQTTILINGVLNAEKQFFLPLRAASEAAEYPLHLRAGIYLIRLHNPGLGDTQFSVHHILTFPAVAHERFTKKPPEDQSRKRVTIHQRENLCEITTVGAPNEARVFGSMAPWYSCSFDDKVLVAEYRYSLDAGETIEVSFLVTFSPDGSGAAVDGFLKCQDARHVLDRSIAAYDEILSRTLILTPEPVINRGLQWAKVNSVRVQHTYRIGEAFTNDPPQDIVVIRDLGWYVLGADYISPAFSRSLLELAEKYAFYDGGKLTEFIHANETVPEKHDYKLNINDDTPLYVYALYHHAVTCGDRDFLCHGYPLMKRACDWILSQVNDGLVRCFADGTNVWGICSWRNIIDGYNLTGAVTEINAECYHALRLTAAVAQQLDQGDEAAHFVRAADDLKKHINTQLISEKTGLYLLNLGNDGVRHHDVTGDLIFPVMFDIAEPEMRQRILDRLMSEEFWTPYGTRTVSPKEWNYDPDFGYQLVGGVWPNLTAWTAFCVRNDHPEKLVEGMLNTYRLSEVEWPGDFLNVVPGEFPERLHGETFISRGMTMSPWMPPTYLWLGVEGLMGVKPTLEGLEINPVIPPEWKWVAIKDLLYKNEKVSAFLHDGTLYSTRSVISKYPLKVGAKVNTTIDNDRVFCTCIAVDDDLLLFAASDEQAEGKVTIEISGSRNEIGVKLKAGEAILISLPLIRDKSTAEQVSTVK